MGCVFAVAQAGAVVGVLLCLGANPDRTTGTHRSDQWSKTPGYAVGFGAWLQLSFLAINSLALNLAGQEVFTGFTSTRASTAGSVGARGFACGF